MELLKSEFTDDIKRKEVMTLKMQGGETYSKDGNGLEIMTEKG